MASMPARPALVTVGVDTHADSHVAAVVDQTGRVLGSASFAASTRGHVALVNWAERLGPVAKIGIEGTGTYGAGLARLCAPAAWRSSRLTDPTAGPAAAWAVRPDRRRGGRSSHPVWVASTTLKTREGQVERIRVLRVARRVR